MPQFDPESFLLAQVVWLILIFGMLFLLTWAMLPKVAGVGETRQRTIEGDLDAAEQARRDADAKREAYEAELARIRAEAQALVGSAKAEAARANEARLAKADEAVQARMDQAEAELAAARDAALGRLDAIAAAATQDIVERLIGSRPTETQAQMAVAAAQARAEG